MSQPPVALVSCSDCNAELPPEFGQEIKGKVCPSCGSTKLTLRLNFVDALEVQTHANMAGVVKDPRLPSKKKTRVRFFSGDDQRKADGKWMQKERVIDRDKNRYTEKVVDPDTGEVVHHCDEPLTDHVGHGSARLKADK